MNMTDADRDAAADGRQAASASKALNRMRTMHPNDPEFDPDDYEELREIVESEGGEAE